MKTDVSGIVILTCIDAHSPEVRVIDCKCILACWIGGSEGAQSSRNGEQRKNEGHDLGCK